MSLRTVKDIRMDRRTLLVGGGTGAGLLLAWWLWPRTQATNLAVKKGETALGAFVKIDTDGRVTVAVPQAEMGQGVWTALPQLLADSLGADWKMVAVEAAPIGKAYANGLLLNDLQKMVLPGWAGPAGRLIRSWPDDANVLQATVGSNSVPAFRQAYVDAGTMARALLMKAAAAKWDTDWKTLEARQGFIVNGAERLSFGELAEAAAGIDPPHDIPAPDPAIARLAGRSVPRLDTPPKLDGSARFGADVRLPNLLYAAVRAGPPGESRLTSADDKAAMKLRGVMKVIKQDQWVAAVGESWWVANHALNAMKPRFETRGGLAHDAAIKEALGAALREGSEASFKKGDADAVLAGGKPLTAEYAAPMLAHASPETPNATARVAGEWCEIWTATQSATLVRDAVADALGYAREMVVVYPTLVGGGFGRLIDTRAAVQAALIAAEMKRPVQLVWSRYEDVIHDAMRPPMRARIEARLTPDKTIAGWKAVIAAPDTAGHVARALLPGLSMGDAARMESIEGAVPAYDIPAMAVAHRLAETGLPPGLWRSGTNSATAFFTESFIDELAAAAGLDPLTFRIRLLNGSPRHAEALKTVASVGGYAPYAGETAQGLAVHETRGAVAAMMAEVTIDKDQGIKVGRVTCAVDCGPVVNPDLVKQQVEGGIVFGLAGIQGRGIGWSKGIPQPLSLGDMALPLMADAPAVEVHIMNSNAPVAGVSGVAVPLVAPAVANALFAATGKRIRQLPLTGQPLS